MACQVCVENYNRSTHKRIDCAFCSFDTCTQCAGRFLCETPHDPQCMSCKKSWNLDFLLANFTKKFVNVTLKQHKEKLLFDREIALLPMTQPLVEREIRKRRLNAEKDPLNELRTTLVKEYDVASGLYTDACRRCYHRTSAGIKVADPSMRAEVNRLYKYMTKAVQRVREVTRQITEINRAIRGMNRTQNNNNNNNGAGGAAADGNNGAEGSRAATERKQFVRKCPFSECRGFLSSQYKCGICENYTCNDCMEVIGPHSKREEGCNHVCKQENIETVKMLAKDTKPCPRCGEMIFKISGCSQMFCTTCTAVWNWNTGKEVTSGVLHNPHYYEWRQRAAGGGGDAGDAQPMMPRPIGDVPCGGVPDPFVMERSLRQLGLKGREIDGCDLVEFVRWLHHLHDVVRARYIVNFIVDNSDLRVKYMMKEIDEKRFQQLLQMRDKAQYKKREIEQVIAMVYEVAGDLLRAVCNAPDADTVMATVGELKVLVNYGKESMAKIASKFSCMPPSIGTFAFAKGWQTVMGAYVYAHV